MICTVQESNVSAWHTRLVPDARSSDWWRCSQASSRTVIKAWHTALPADWPYCGDQTENYGECSVMGCPCRVTGWPRGFA